MSLLKASGENHIWFGDDPKGSCVRILVQHVMVIPRADGTFKKMRTRKVLSPLCLVFPPGHITTRSSVLPSTIKPSPEWVWCSFVFLGSEIISWKSLFSSQSICPQCFPIELENWQLTSRSKQERNSSLKVNCWDPVVMMGTSGCY